jgi:Initiator Replication protein
MIETARVSRAIEQKKSQDGFVKPGELIDIRAGAELSLQDRRIFNLLIENAWSEIGEDKPHRIAMNRLRGPTHRGSERVADSVKTLMTTLVEVPTMLDGQAAIFTTQLCGETTRVIDEDSPNAVLVYNFPKGLRRIIQDSRYWGRIKAYVMFAFGSKYALALYEAVCLRGNLRVSEQRFSVDEFRALLGVEDGKYPGFPQLKQKVVVPAVLEVNALSDFKVEVEPVRDGGMVRGPLSGFILRWEKKSGDEWKGVLDELLRPKVGRVARMQGKVERIL